MKNLTKIIHTAHIRGKIINENSRVQLNEKITVEERERKIGFLLENFNGKFSKHSRLSFDCQDNFLKPQYGIQNKRRKKRKNYLEDSAK